MYNLQVISSWCLFEVVKPMSENKSHFESSHFPILDYPFLNYSCVCKAMPQKDKICGKGNSSHSFGHRPNYTPLIHAFWATFYIFRNHEMSFFMCCLKLSKNDNFGYRSFLVFWMSLMLKLASKNS